jgi:5'(3')-deoxyribonucleotidase
MQRIAIDMDEVIADTLGRYLKIYNADFGRNLTREDLRGQHALEMARQEDIPRIRQYFQDEKFFSGIDPMPGSQEVVKALAEIYEVFVTSSAMEVPVSFTPKFLWLKQHFPFISSTHVVFCGDKAIISADFLIDDNVRHFERFQGEGILFTAPHNVNETRFRRVDTWHDVRAMFLRSSTDP